MRANPRGRQAARRHGVDVPQRTRGRWRNSLHRRASGSGATAVFFAYDRPYLTTLTRHADCPVRADTPKRVCAAWPTRPYFVRSPRITVAAKSHFITERFAKKAGSPLRDRGSGWNVPCAGLSSQGARKQFTGPAISSEAPVGGRWRLYRFLGPPEPRFRRPDAVASRPRTSPGRPPAVANAGAGADRAARPAWPRRDGSA